MKINMSVIAVSVVVMNAMFVACRPIFPMTDALDRTIENCTFEKPEDLCFFENPQEQIWVEKGGNKSINLLLYSSEAIGQGLNATRQNISVMDTDDNVIINGNNVTHFLRKNWNMNVDFIQESIKRRNVFIINLTVSLNYATDSEVVHFEIRYGNLIYKTGFIHINITAADRGNPTLSPASSTVSETWNNSQWSTSTATDLPTTTSTTNVPPCYQSGPSNSAIFWTMICGFAFLAVLIKWKWISSQVMRLIPTWFQQNLPCTVDQPSPSGNDPATDLFPLGTGKYTPTFL